MHWRTRSFFGRPSRRNYQRGFAGSDGTLVFVVLAENGMHSVAGDVAAVQALSPEKGCKQDDSHWEERLDRTQEVAGSSPASSIEASGNSGFRSYLLPRCSGMSCAMPAPSGCCDVTI
jgi:hypothetical protein